MSSALQLDEIFYEEKFVGRYRWDLAGRLDCMRNYFRFYEGFNFISTIIDNNSKFPLVIPLKTKTGKGMATA